MGGSLGFSARVYQHVAFQTRCLLVAVETTGIVPGWLVTALQRSAEFHCVDEPRGAVSQPPAGGELRLLSVSHDYEQRCREHIPGSLPSTHRMGLKGFVVRCQCSLMFVRSYHSSK